MAKAVASLMPAQGCAPLFLSRARDREALQSLHPIEQHGPPVRPLSAHSGSSWFLTRVVPPRLRHAALPFFCKEESPGCKWGHQADANRTLERQADRLRQNELTTKEHITMNTILACVCAGGLGVCSTLANCSWSQPPGRAVGTPNYGSSVQYLYDGQLSTTSELDEVTSGARRYFGVVLDQPAPCCGVRFHSLPQGWFINAVGRFHVTVLPAGKEDLEGNWAEVVPETVALHAPGWNEAVFTNGPVEISAVRVHYLAVAYNGAATVAELELSLGAAFTLDPTTTTVPSSGGTGGFQVTPTPRDSRWTAASDVAWIELDPASATGSGQGSVSFKVSPNPESVARSGIIRVDGAVFQVNQDAAPDAPQWRAVRGEGLTLVGTPNWGFSLDPLSDGNLDSATGAIELDEARPGSFPWAYFGGRFAKPWLVAGVRFFSYPQAYGVNHIQSFKVHGLPPGRSGLVESDWVELVPESAATGELPGWVTASFAATPVVGLRVLYTQVSYGYAPRVGEFEFLGLPVTEPVAPRLSLSVEGGKRILSWPTENGCRYQVQAATEAGQPFADFGAPLTGSGDTARVESLPEGPIGIFRVRVDN